jgi:hypothetical protein
MSGPSVSRPKNRSLPSSNASACRNGGLTCADGSVYAAYNSWAVPAGLVSGVSLVQCYIKTDPAYCPASNGSISYCEPSAAGGQLYCVSVSLPSPPP